jgi:endonuclease/exonuclease/phosphatase family metal-dependent hydrolase
MPRRKYFDPDPGIAGKVDPFSPLWLRLEAITKKIGIKSIIRWVDKIISVAGPVGPVFMSTIPTSAADGECRTLSVLSANLWHDWPRFRNIENRLESFAKLVEQEGIDLILLQEIARTPTIKVDNLLAERLNMSYVYSRANGSANIGFEEGLGVFSRFRMKRFPDIRQVGRVINPFVRRLALGVEIETPCGSMLAVSVHLGLLRGHNTRQVTELHHWINRLAAGRSVVIGGDFNAPEKSRRIGKVRTFWQDAYREAPTRGRSYTHSINWPWGGHLMSHRIDYIFLQPGIPGWNVTEAYHLDAPGGPHSDHLAVVARLAPMKIQG